MKKQYIKPVVKTEKKDVRTIRDIKRDIRTCWHNVSISRQMIDRECEEHYITEARAYERELELRQTGYVLTTA